MWPLFLLRKRGEQRVQVWVNSILPVEEAVDIKLHFAEWFAKLIEHHGSDYWLESE